MPTGNTLHPIARVHDDILRLIFSSAHEGRSIGHDQKTALALPLLLSHVCRRWRTAVLAQPGLWIMFHWDPGDNIEAALAMLERARAASLVVSFSIGSPTRKHVTDEMQANGRVVLEALFGHLWHTSSFRLFFRGGTLDDIVLPRLFSSDGPCAFPRLRRLTIETTGKEGQDALPLNIACPPLAYVFLRAVQPRHWFGMLGDITTSLHLNGLVFQIGELRQVLYLAPNLRTFSLVFCRINPDTDKASEDDGRAIGARLEELNVFSLPPADLILLQTLRFPVGRIQTVTFDAHWTDTTFDAAYAFLRPEELADVTSAFINADGASFRTSSGAHRLYSGGRMSIPVLRDMFTDTPLRSTIRTLTVGLSVWPALLQLLADGAQEVNLPLLEQLNLQVVQDEFVDDPAEDNALRTLLVAPALARLEVSLHGRAMPSAPLVRRFIRTVMGLRPGAPVTAQGLSLFDYHYGYLPDGSDRSHMERFSELLGAEMNPGGLLEPFAAPVPPSQ